MSIIIFLNLIPESRQLGKAEDDRVRAIRHLTKARFQAPCLCAEGIREIKTDLGGLRNRRGLAPLDDALKTTGRLNGRGP
jgi:hypothetical protein